MDPYGWHALHCSHGPYLIQRHNAIRDELAKYLKQAHMTYQIEQRYRDYDAHKGLCEEMDRKIPGDIVVSDWYDATSDKAYFDVTIGNVFCKSYINEAAKDIHYISKLKEKQKKMKYSNVLTMEPMVMDTMGAFGESFKINLQHIAKRVALLKQSPYSIVINRMRTRLTAILHKYNAKMIISSIPL